MKALLPLYVKLQSKLRYTAKDEKGATMVEYALMVALIAAACITIVTSVGTKSAAVFTEVAGKLAP